jgi:hypothetical protein
MDDKDALIEKLRSDLLNNCDAPHACEACGAQLFDGDDYHSEDVTGCWPWVTNYHESTAKNPCYKYRVAEMSEKRVRFEKEQFEKPRGVERYVTDEIRERLARLETGSIG